MKFHPLAATLATCALALGAASSAQALTVLDFGPGTVVYDENSDFGSNYSTSSAGPNTFGFAWSVPGNVQVVGTGDLVTADFTLPSFTVTAKPGFVLTGMQSFFGNVAFTEIGGAVTGILAYADVSIDGGPVVSISGNVDWQTSVSGPGFLIGFFAETEALNTPATFTTLTVSNAYIVLSASGGTLGTIYAQPQNLLEYTVTAEPVPEPATYLMLMSGVAVLGWVASRRRRKA